MRDAETKPKSKHLEELQKSDVDGPETLKISSYVLKEPTTQSQQIMTRFKN